MFLKRKKIVGYIFLPNLLSNCLRLPYNYSLYEDIDLVEMIRVDHDQMAFEEIYMRYAEPLFRLAFQKTNNKEASEDIVQITFIKLWAGRANLKINYSLKAYLYTSA